VCSNNNDKENKMDFYVTFSPLSEISIRSSVSPSAPVILAADDFLELSLLPSPKTSNRDVSATTETGRKRERGGEGEEGTIRSAISMMMIILVVIGGFVWLEYVLAPPRW